MATHWVCLAAAGPRCQPLECILCTSVSACGLASWPAFSKVSLDSSGSSTHCCCSCGTKEKANYRWAVSPFQELLASAPSKICTLSPFSLWKRCPSCRYPFCGLTGWNGRTTLVTWQTPQKGISWGQTWKLQSTGPLREVNLWETPAFLSVVYCKFLLAKAWRIQYEPSTRYCSCNGLCHSAVSVVIRAWVYRYCSTNIFRKEERKSTWKASCLIVWVHLTSAHFNWWSVSSAYYHMLFTELLL